MSVAASVDGGMRVRMGRSILEVEHQVLAELIGKAPGLACSELQMAFETPQRPLARQLGR